MQAFLVYVLHGLYDMGKIFRLVVKYSYSTDMELIDFILDGIKLNFIEYRIMTLCYNINVTCHF